MFQWLAKTDLLAIPKGKHPIEGTERFGIIREEVMSVAIKSDIIFNGIRVINLIRARFFLRSVFR